MVKKLTNIGIMPGKDFDYNALPEKTKACLQYSLKEAQKEIVQASKKLGTIKDGWNLVYDIGSYGADYLKRAVVAFIGFGANLPEDAVYPTAFLDRDGNQLDGHNNYVLHFNADQLPPARAFWSVTLYNDKSFLVPNTLHRYALGDRDVLTFHKDGSLDIYFQYKSPGKDKESNWLPVPNDIFNVTMRLYWPEKSVLNGTWNPPGIIKNNKV